MKKCRQCGYENDNEALGCHSCRHRVFEPEVVPSPTRSDLRKFISKTPHLTTETAGKLSVLKCRTPGEAILVAEELEAGDILVMFPDEEDMLQEFETHGYVSLKVSAQAYAAAKELQGVIECRQWQKRADQRLSVKMALVAVGLGIVFFPGLIFFFMLFKRYEKKGINSNQTPLANGFLPDF